MVLVTQHQNVLPWEELPLGLVLLHLVFAVSSASPVGAQVARTTPTPSSVHIRQVQTKTHVPTHSAKLTQMSAN